MRDTAESEKMEVQAAAEDLARARDLLTLAERAASRTPGPSSPLAEDAAREWVLTSVAERRHTDALEAQVAGERRRERLTKLRDSERTHVATLAFVADNAPHSEDEDMHPTRLDPSSADLERSLEGSTEGRT